MATPPTRGLSLKPIVICLIALLCLQLCIIPLITAFGAPNEFQPNPFLSPKEQERIMKKEQKIAANKLVQDPPPAVIRNGPPSDYRFDRDLPNTVGDLAGLNDEHIRPILHNLVRTAYFRYYKVNLHAECPYWAMNRMCTSGGGCNVCECDENEVPKPWIVESTDSIKTTPESELFDHSTFGEHDVGGFGGGGGDELEVEDNLTPHERMELRRRKLLQQWDSDEAGVWSDAEHEQALESATYVNLIENPEGNTGYSGEEPRRIWDAIYNENCFATIGTNNVDSMCLEDRLMYRLVSGLHASITAHVFKNWKLNETNYEYIHNQFLWNMMFTTQYHNNQTLLEQRNNTNPNDLTMMSPQDVKVLERINNLYFTLELLLDSLSTLHHDAHTTPKILILPAATPDATATADGNNGDNIAIHKTNNTIIINTGDQEQDLYTANLLKQLIQVAHSRARHYTPTTQHNLAESQQTANTNNNNHALTTDEQQQQQQQPRTLRDTFATLGDDHINSMRHLFHNVSIIMNCVGCEKCRIWSKLNILGISTALKLSAAKDQDMVSMKRNELIALINTLNSFSLSVGYTSSLSRITPPYNQIMINEFNLKEGKNNAKYHEAEASAAATAANSNTSTSSTTTTTKKIETRPNELPKEEGMTDNGKIFMILIFLGVLYTVYTAMQRPVPKPNLNSAKGSGKKELTQHEKMLEQKKLQLAANTKPNSTAPAPVAQPTAPAKPQQPLSTKGKNRKLE